MSGYVGNVLWMNRDFGREFGLPYDQLDIQFFSFSFFILSKHAPLTKSLWSLCVLGCRQVQFYVLDQTLSPRLSKS